MNGNRVISWIELGVFASLMSALVFFHFTVLTHSGGLWRDEVNSLNISTLPSLADIWDKMQFDSFPILWLLILRTWVNVGLGETDLALRALGLIIGLGMLCALWFVSRNLAMRLPLISLVLFALCPTSFIGDSLRAYGLGVILILLAMGSMWRAIQDPVPWKMAVGLVAAVFSVQCLYHNAFLLFAICVGAVAVCIYRRRWRLISLPLGIGAIAAISMMPYHATVLKAGDWSILFKNPVTLSWILKKVNEAIDPSGMFLMWIWFVLALFVMAACVWVLITSFRRRSGEEGELECFLLVTMLVSIVSYIAFIKILSYPTQSWYYLPLMAVLAVIIDKGVDAVCERFAGFRWARVAVLAGVVVLIFMNSWDAAHIRRTNMDLLAARLETISAKDDLIVVFPFYYGISFAHYYKGSTAWVTLPEMEDHSVHRYDLFKERMMQNEPIQSVLEGMIRTLKNGNKVWLVGGWSFLRQGELPGNVAPAPNSPYGWNEGVYQMTWSRNAAYALQEHGRTIGQIPIRAVDPVNAFENVPLLVVQGWRP